VVFLDIILKVSYSIFLVGAILLFVEIMIVQADLASNSSNLTSGLVSDDMIDKIMTLYFFIIIILFFFGGIVFLFEQGAQGDPLRQYPETLEKNSKLQNNSTKVTS
jgi:hypothetical protein